MRVLITGITGFVGSHLAEYVLGLGHEVHGVERWRSKTDNIEHIRVRLVMHECDLRDASSVRQVVEAIHPHRIFHLAAQSFVPMSWSAPAETLTTNILSELHLFEAVRDAGSDSEIQVAGSSEEYGLVDDREIPVREETPLRPISPYGVSKVAQDLLAFQYFRSYKMKIVRTRGFNHTGPRRGDVFAESDFSKQIAMVEQGLQEPVLRVGNLEAARDFTDVRDMVTPVHFPLDQATPLFNTDEGGSTEAGPVGSLDPDSSI